MNFKENNIGLQLSDKGPYVEGEIRRLLNTRDDARLRTFQRTSNEFYNGYERAEQA